MKEEIDFLFYHLKILILEQVTWALSYTCRNKGLNVVIDGRNLFYQPVKNNFITYDNIQRITASQGGDYKTGCLSDYDYFNN